MTQSHVMAVPSPDETVPAEVRQVLYQVNDVLLPMSSA
jgi:hypothetical protein